MILGVLRFGAMCPLLAVACCAPATASHPADSLRVLDGVSARIAVGGASKVLLTSPAGARLEIARDVVVANNIEGAIAEVNSPEDVNEMDESPPVVISLQLSRVLAGRWLLRVERAGDEVIDIDVRGEVLGGKGCEAGDLSEGPRPRSRTWAIQVGSATADSCTVSLSPLPVGVKRKQRPKTTP